MMNPQILKTKFGSVGLRAFSTSNRKWLIFLAIFFAAIELRAQSWNNVGTGDWFFAPNWTPQMVPNSTSIATVANGGTAEIGVEESSQTASAGQLTVGSTSIISITSLGTLEIATSLSNSGHIVSAINGVTLLAGASATNNATGMISATAPATGGPFTEGILVSGNGAAIANAGLISGENGIFFNTGGSVTNMAGGTIQGVSRNDNGFSSQTGSGIYAFANTSLVTVLNEAGATIQGLGTFSWGIHTGLAPINITNFGVISGTVNAINVNGGGTFINEAGASITSTTFQPVAVTSGGTENITNFGAISSSFGGIGFSNGNANGTVTNNAGGIIAGTAAGSFGIATGSANVINFINSGTISGGGSGVALSGGGSITNNAGGSITAAAPTTGAFTQGILISNTAAKIVNAGLISGENGIV